MFLFCFSTLTKPRVDLTNSLMVRKCFFWQDTLLRREEKKYVSDSRKVDLPRDWKVLMAQLQLFRLKSKNRWFSWVSRDILSAPSQVWNPVATRGMKGPLWMCEAENRVIPVFSENF